MGTRVFANHAHVSPASINPKGTIDQLLQLLDACEIEGALCFAPFAEQCDDKAIDPNVWLACELKSRPRLAGLGTVDARREDVRDQVKRIAELGLKGIKLHPNVQEFGLLSPRAREVYAAAQDLDLFLVFHTGVHQSRIRDMHVLMFDDVAWDYPRLRFSMEHVGGYHFFNDALAVLFNHVPPPWAADRPCRVFAGLSSVFTQHVNRFWYLGPERIMELIAQIGARHCIFGLDFPYNREEETRIGLEMLRSLNLREEELAGILGGNLRRELRL